ncbi:V-set domain containing T-cell activation inhibitor 1-like isoform X2 [Polypterus senegalus]|uniref:V-set domain containing T-cell activation inhibitor 1-like isoform X2 n=1 Tax=Polypterus senegalus TaxID=55291 RepID=UPI00196559E4|nr:V-set domain containing T-cell activation inhibitor 1-like isoform X2 [Polypterus senegalus]
MAPNILSFFSSVYSIQIYACAIMLCVFYDVTVCSSEMSDTPIALCHCSFITNTSSTLLKLEKEAKTFQKTVLLYSDRKVQPSNCSHSQRAECLIEELEKGSNCLSLRHFESTDHLKHTDKMNNTRAGWSEKKNLTVNVTQLTSSSNTNPKEIHVTVNKTVVVDLFHDVVIPCTFNGSIELLSSFVYWTKQNSSKTSIIMAFENGTRQPGKESPSYRNRTQLMFDTTVGDASLFLRKVLLTDSGSYVCRVGSFKSGTFGEAGMNLTVTASSTTLIVQNNDKNLTVSSSYWFPAPEIYWLDDKGQDITNHSCYNITRTADGLYHITSCFHIGNADKMDFLISCINPVSKKNTSVVYSYKGTHPDSHSSTSTILWIFLGVSALIIFGIGILIGKRYCAGSKKDVRVNM